MTVLGALLLYLLAVAIAAWRVSDGLFLQKILPSPGNNPPTIPWHRKRRARGCTR